MTSAMLALILTIWALPVPGEAAGPRLSTNLANLLTIYNGYYDNRAQYEKNKKLHDYIQFKTVSVTTPAFPGRHVLFEEWSVNNVLFKILLITLYEDSDGVIHLSPYNFTDPSLYKPGEYKVEDLSKLTPQDLQPSTCEAELEPDGPGTYIGTWPACRHFVNGEPALYSVTLTCDTLETVAPRSASETSSRLPYILTRKGSRFPVPDLPDGFVSPC